LALALIFAALPPTVPRRHQVQICGQRPEPRRALASGNTAATRLPVEVPSHADIRYPISVEAKPSFLSETAAHADLVIVRRPGVWEIGCLPPALSRNHTETTKIQCRRPVILLTLPASQNSGNCRRAVLRAEGDVPPHGNPHYWPTLQWFAASPKALRQDERDAPRLRHFAQRLTLSSNKLNARARPSSGWRKGTRTPERKIVTYHRSWPNFAELWI